LILFSSWRFDPVSYRIFFLQQMQQLAFSASVGAAIVPKWRIAGDALIKFLHEREWKTLLERIEDRRDGKPGSN